MIWKFIGLFAVIIGTAYPIPQVAKTISTGKAIGISRYFLTLWFMDKFLSFLYVSHLGDHFLMVKYGLGVVFVSILVYYKVLNKRGEYEKKKTETP